MDPTDLDIEKPSGSKFDALTPSVFDHNQGNVEGEPMERSEVHALVELLLDRVDTKLHGIVAFFKDEYRAFIPVEEHEKLLVKFQALQEQFEGERDHLFKHIQRSNEEHKKSINDLTLRIDNVTTETTNQREEILRVCRREHVARIKKELGDAEERMLGQINPILICMQSITDANHARSTAAQKVVEGKLESLAHSVAEHTLRIDSNEKTMASLADDTNAIQQDIEKTFSLANQLIEATSLATVQCSRCGFADEDKGRELNNPDNLYEELFLAAKSHRSPWFSMNHSHITRAFSLVIKNTERWIDAGQQNRVIGALTSSLQRPSSLAMRMISILTSIINRPSIPRWLFPQSQSAPEIILDVCHSPKQMAAILLQCMAFALGALGALAPLTTPRLQNLWLYCLCRPPPRPVILQYVKPVAIYVTAAAAISLVFFVGVLLQATYDDDYGQHVSTRDVVRQLRDAQYHFEYNM